MGVMPDFFRDQLPDPIKLISDAAHARDISHEWLDDYTYMAEYTYPILGQNGQPCGTSLGLAQGYEPMSFEAGQEICLHGVWVEVVSVETATEIHEEDGRRITFYDVEIREKEQL